MGVSNYLLISWDDSPRWVELGILAKSGLSLFWPWISVDLMWPCNFMNVYISLVKSGHILRVSPTSDYSKDLGPFGDGGQNPGQTSCSSQTWTSQSKSSEAQKREIKDVLMKTLNSDSIASTKSKDFPGSHQVKPDFQLSTFQWYMLELKGHLLPTPPWVAWGLISWDVLAAKGRNSHFFLSLQRWWGLPCFPNQNLLAS